jgi:hypothetical protein
MKMCQRSEDEGLLWARLDQGRNIPEKSTYWTRLSNDEVVARYDALVDIYLERQLTARQHKQRDALEAEMTRRGFFANCETFDKVDMCDP